MTFPSPLPIEDGLTANHTTYTSTHHRHDESPTAAPSAAAPAPVALAPATQPALLARSQNNRADANEGSGHMQLRAASGSPQLTGGLSDGRIRNPVPSKLKGKTDGRNGNFSVMQIDLARPEMTQRDLAAKRTSEGTAAAARLANKEGYRPVRRSRLAWCPREYDPQTASASSSSPQTAPGRELASAAMPSHPQSSPTSFPSPLNPGATTLPTASPFPLPIPSAAQRGLSPHEASQEQARLLTLLQSLSPGIVVEQICRALSYFGGTPGAPVPESAAQNGPGSLFVGWIAEIFPPRGDQPGIVDSGEQPQTETPPVAAPAAAAAAAATAATTTVTMTTTTTATAVTEDSSATQNSAPVKRARGRPKGSKSSKVRKDKGIKKSGASKQGPDGNSWQLSTAAPPQATQPDTTGAEALSSQDQASAIAQAALQGQAGADVVVTPGSKKRGRPKGSKNKPKVQPGSQNGMAGVLAVPSDSQAPDSVVDSPLAHKSNASKAADAGDEAQAHTTAPRSSADGQQVTGFSVNDQMPPVALQGQPGQPSDGLSVTKSPHKRKQTQPESPEGQVNADSQMPTESHVQQPERSAQAQNAKRRKTTAKGSVQRPAPHEQESPAYAAANAIAPANLALSRQFMSTTNSFDGRGGQGNNIRGQQIAMQKHQQNSQQQPQVPVRVMRASDYTSGPNQGGQQSGQLQQNQSRFQVGLAQEHVPFAGQTKQARAASARNAQSQSSNASPVLNTRTSQQPAQPVGEAPPAPMGAFQGYGDQTYVNMGHSMGNSTGAMVDSTDALPFGDHPNLDGMGDAAAMRERFYSSMGRQ